MARKNRKNKTARKYEVTCVVFSGKEYSEHIAGVYDKEWKAKMAVLIGMTKQAEALVKEQTDGISIDIEQMYIFWKDPSAHLGLISYSWKVTEVAA